MSPQEHLRALPDGIRCTVCDERVPADRVRLLAQRNDLLFLQIDCAACGSTALGFVANDVVRPETDRLAGGAPLSSDDVLDMHEFLGSWSGDLTFLGVEAGSRREPRLRPAVRRVGHPA